MYKDATFQISDLIMVRKNNLKIVSIRESVSLWRDGMDAQYMQYLAKAIKLDYRYDKSLFKCPVFLIQVFYDQRDSYTCPKAMQKIVKTKCVVGKVLLFLFFLSFLLSLFSTMISRKQFKFSLSF